DRFRRPARVGRAAVFVLVLGKALEGVPAEVGTARRAHGRVVELLELVLADVADRDPWLRAADLVEGEAERVAQAVAVDLVAAGLADERVAGGDRVRPAAARGGVHPQELAG